MLEVILSLILGAFIVFTILMCALWFSESSAEGMLIIFFGFTLLVSCTIHISGCLSSERSMVEEAFKCDINEGTRYVIDTNKNILTIITYPSTDTRLDKIITYNVKDNDVLKINEISKQWEIKGAFSK